MPRRVARLDRECDEACSHSFVEVVSTRQRVPPVDLPACATQKFRREVKVLNFPEDATSPNSVQPGLLRRFLAYRDTQRAARAKLPDLPGEILVPADHPPKPLSRNDFPAIVLTRNDMVLIGSFLRHYRRLGVTRFIVVDDQSTDGTSGFLLDQPDVDLWTSPLRYKEARRGRAWREWLFRHYGKDRWYLNIDSDEFLFFAGWEHASLSVVTAALSNRWQLRLAAPMLDLYPVGPLDGRSIILEDGQEPWDVANHFDIKGYALRLKKRGLSIKGGPLARMFGTDLESIKYPLLFVDDQTHLASNIHHPAPFGRNFIPIEGVLLHCKIFSDFEKKITDRVQNGQHFNGSAGYKKIENELKATGQNVDFKSDVSARFEGVDDLVAKGFLRDWRVG